MNPPLGLPKEPRLLTTRRTGTAAIQTPATAGPTLTASASSSGPREESLREQLGTSLFSLVLRAQTGRRQGAVEDTDWLLEHRPEGMNIDRVKELRRLLDRPE